MIEKEMIEFWKTNERAFMFCSKECQDWLMAQPDCLVLVEKSHIEAVWRSNGGSCGGNPAVIYRIPADYEPEKKGRWVECPIFVEDNAFYAFHPPISCSQKKVGLFEASGMVGFGGVFYRGFGWTETLRYCGGEPFTPTKVRFWVEE